MRNHRQRLTKTAVLVISTAVLSLFQNCGNSFEPLVLSGVSAQSSSAFVITAVESSSGQAVADTAALLVGTAYDLNASGPDIANSVLIWSISSQSPGCVL